MRAAPLSNACAGSSLALPSRSFCGLFFLESLLVDLPIFVAFDALCCVTQASLLHEVRSVLAVILAVGFLFFGVRLAEFFFGKVKF